MVVVDFSNVKARVCVAFTVTLSWFDVVPSALAVATFVTEPKSISAWVTT